MDSTPKTDFVRARRMHQRGHYDEATIHAVLDAAPMCHVAHLIGGRPVAIPTFHWRHGDSVYWHGSAASRMLRANKVGGEVCLTATLLDGFVMARSGFHHSANYRSAMCFGIPHLLEDRAEILLALKGFTDRLVPGRWETLRPPTEQEMKATSVFAMIIDEASAKIRTGPPGDDPGDEVWPIWGGVLPVGLTALPPQPDAYVQERFAPPVTPFTA
jgi:nitroimidazol reductase NimA-like FMN-containing flavoprotein (pyridoxamine 5'-phosphate oxidase superfamily)